MMEINLDVGFHEKVYNLLFEKHHYYRVNIIRIDIHEDCYYVHYNVIDNEGEPKPHGHKITKTQKELYFDNGMW